MSGHWVRAGLAVLLVLAVMLALPAPPLSAAASVTGVPTVTPGTFRFLAQGFEDDEEVSTRVTGPRQQVQASGICEANGRGDVNFTIRMPRHFEPGRWAITVHGLVSDREAIGFFWMPTLGANVPLVAVPPEGPRGVVVIFRGAGFAAGEQVNYWPTGPSDVAYDGGQTTANGDGQVEFLFLFGAESEPGRWAMSAYGMESDRLGVARFTLT
jgi:hypothetical protein